MTAAWLIPVVYACCLTAALHLLATPEPQEHQ